MGDVPGRRVPPPPFFSVPAHRHGEFGYFKERWGLTLHGSEEWMRACGVPFFPSRADGADLWLVSDPSIGALPRRSHVLCRQPWAMVRSAGTCAFSGGSNRVIDTPPALRWRAGGVPSPVWGFGESVLVERVVPTGLCAPILYSEVYPVEVLANCIVASGFG